jgi:predicted DCC family thiol-disulfide oxidoreductase YuxK
MSGADPDRDPVIIFDGDCPFCNGWVDVVLRHDARACFRFAARQSEAGRRILTRLGVVPDELGSIAVVLGHKIYTRSDAILWIVRHLGFPWNTLCALALVPRRLRDFGYAVIARNRFRLSRRRTACRAERPSDDARFLR